MPDPRACDECEEEMEPRQRRRWCFHCGGFVCAYCWHHQHQCAPQHSLTDCWSWRAYQKYGMAYRKRLRSLYLKRATQGQQHNLGAMLDSVGADG